MRFRKSNVIFGFGIVFGIFILFFFYDNSPHGLYGDDEAKKVELEHLEAKLKNLETDLELNQNIIKDIKGSVKDIVAAQENLQKIKVESKKGKSPVNKTMATIDKNDVKFAQELPSQCQIEMNKVYDKLTFDNPDGGVWKQGWDVKYDKNQWSSGSKLKVFVVPHSHNDPGWIKTFEQYYADQTRKILDLMVEKLSKYTAMKFIWAEISYFSLWWAEQTTQVRSMVLSLLAEGRLEIVTGGYVMPDEANSAYTAILEQLIYGHEWCSVNLDGYKPNSGWSIDPFGMSPTNAYILKRAGFDNMLIQRTHYSVKKHLAKEKNLEFLWRQHWDHADTSDILCHMMPFYSYDIPHTCGPDPKICCQFDFLRLPGSKHSCPWRVAPKKISADNVRERAETLLDQYRKKAQLYQTNSLFVPLGDDFRWEGGREWDDQYINYQQLMDHINSRPDLQTEIQWGTLSDYFNSARDDSKSKTSNEIGLFPTLSGDFFTYADRDDHYWSGYFTSRPFWKNLDRVLEGYLRAAEVSFSLSWAEMEYIGSDKTELANKCTESLMTARRALSLFQHHDGITGTAKDHVVLDYGDKMLRAIKLVQEVISQTSHFLLSKSKATYKASPGTSYFDLDDSRAASWSIPTRTVIQVDHPDMPNRLVVYNSHARRRQELVTVLVSKPDIKVYYMDMVEGEEEEEMLECQVSPVFKSDGEISNNEYEVTFLATVPALGLQTYFLRQLKPEEKGEEGGLTVASIKIFNTDRHPFQVAPFDAVSVTSGGETFSLSNTYLTAEFSEEGLLESLTTRDDKVKTQTKVEFVQYGTRKRGDKSGAYLFMPDSEHGSPRKLTNPLVRVVEGKLRSYVEVHQPWIKHIVVLHNSPGVDGTGIQIENDIDLTSESMNNKEISMRISTNVDSQDTFFTDLNGFQMIKRKRLSKIPMQGNWYPFPSMAYIEDRDSRVSLISGQPLGGTSLSSGQLEVMLDRRLMQDDNRGLFQGVQDNKVTPHHFTLLLERQGAGCTSQPSSSQASYPSLLGLAARHQLLNPLYRLIYMPEHFQGNSLKNMYSPVDKDLPCDIHIINLRTMVQSTDPPKPSDKTALVLHRQGFNSCYRPIGMTCSTNGGKISMDELFPQLYSSSVKQMSLTLMYDGMKMEKSFTVSIQPMEMYSFLLTR